MWPSILNSFKWNSSPIDWCEPNYIFSPSIAEFYNTLSNIFFVVVPPILINLFRPYGRLIHPGIHIVWLMFIIVGICSTYFHMTLSLAGQLLDQNSILWTFSIVLIFFCPKKDSSKIAKKRTDFIAIILAATVIASILSVWHSVANDVMLMSLVIPTIRIVWTEINRIRHKDAKIYELGRRTIFILVCAIAVWINDRIFCDFYISVHVTYLHALWHVLIFLSSYRLVVVLAYVYVETEKPQISFKLSYWPRNEWNFFGIAYIEFNQRSLSKLREGSKQWTN